MSLSTLVVPLICVLAVLFLTAYFVLRVVRDALREIARDEIKAAIPQLSFGLVRRAGADIPEEEHSIVEEWEDRLGRYEHRPLMMLGVAINIYRERTTLAAEVTEPAVAAEGAAPRTYGLTPRVGRFLAAIGTSFGRIDMPSRRPVLVRRGFFVLSFLLPLVVATEFFGLIGGLVMTTLGLLLGALCIWGLNRLP